MRDLGTFYHLLPENPNAAEWLIWWLLGFAISERLQGVFGGMECIVDKLTEKLEATELELKDRLIKNCWVTALEKKGSKLKLGFNPEHKPAAEVASQEYDRVILALPKRALEKIARQSRDAFAAEAGAARPSQDPFAEAEPEILRLLDSAFGFPMVKTFVIVKRRWWQGHRANRYATRVPTRELHYWEALTEDSKQGLIMAYTDRPASSFWANYVPPGRQLDADRSRTTGSRSALDRLPDRTEDRLIKKVVRYLNDNDVPDIRREDIVWYGIRDWGRAPYGGANHAWRPERKYWVVMRRLSHIAEHEGASTPSIHICGEAYSDYHGFMEGSLRSAVYVLHRILDRNPDGTFAALPWLVHEDVKEGTPGSALRVKKSYLEALRAWAARLDDFDRNTEYL